MKDGEGGIGPTRDSKIPRFRDSSLDRFESKNGVLRLTSNGLKLTDLIAQMASGAQARIDRRDPFSFLPVGRHRHFPFHGSIGDGWTS